MTLFDPGLQPERTELAWRRTALSIALGSLVSMRLLPVVFGDARWVFVGVFGAALAAVTWFWARRRYRQSVLVLVREGDRAPLAGAGLLLMLTIGTTLLALAALAIVILAALRPLH